MNDAREWFHRTWTYVVVNLIGAVIGLVVSAIGVFIAWLGHVWLLIGVPWTMAVILTVAMITAGVPIYAGVQRRKMWLASRGIWVR